jgi:thioredoxin 2
VNTEALPDLGVRFKIHSIPTMAVFKNGFEVARQSGAMPSAMIQQFLKQAVNTTRR